MIFLLWRLLRIRARQALCRHRHTQGGSPMLAVLRASFEGRLTVDEYRHLASITPMDVTRCCTCGKEWVRW